MKRHDLATLAMLGISAGMMMGGCQKQGEGGGQVSADEQMGPDMQSFYSALSPEAQKKFRQLDAQHKMMALEMAQQSCQSQNKCQGMGGCGTSQHKCATQNSCKAQGGAAIKDPDKAVDVQFDNQMRQRKKTNEGMNQKGLDRANS